MSKPSQENPNTGAVPTLSSAGVMVNGKYLPPPQYRDGKIWARASALIQGSANDLYEMWRDIENAPRWQEQIVQVTKTGEATSHWLMRSSGDDQSKEKTMEWDSEILADEPGRRIAWRSIGGDSQNAGEVIFEPAPGGRGTMVTVLQEFCLGKLASLWETIVGRSPKQAVIENLRHFKALAETGEIPRIQGQPHGPAAFVPEASDSSFSFGIA